MHQIRRCKPKLHFADAQPMLHDIASVPDWTRVMKGVEKLFVNDVLGQMNVLNKVGFGSLFSWENSN